MRRVRVPVLTLTRLECGDEQQPMSLAGFSDTYANPDFKLQLTYSCYLIRHGDDYMVWDAGNGLAGGTESPKASIVELIGRLQVKPEQVKYLGISHFHHDHIGQAASLAQATLLIGKGQPRCSGFLGTVRLLMKLPVLSNIVDWMENRSSTVSNTSG